MTTTNAGQPGTESDFRHPSIDDQLVDSLRRAVESPDQITLNRGVREHHAVGFGQGAEAPPDIVAFAKSTADVAGVLSACNKAGVPVVAFGAGTSVEGHVVATRGGVCLDLLGMDAVLSIDTGSLTARVQPGVTRTRLNERAGQDGLFFPVDPGADASIGGMIATNASGTTTVRYGSMRQQILSLEVVLADGSVVRTGTLARKSSAGYDLTSLIVGSEGTLGIVTEAALLLQGIPEDTAVLRAQFPDTLSACNCAAGCMAMALSVSRMELMDRATIAMLNEYSDRDDPVEPSLLIEVEGTPSGVKEEIETIIEIAKDAGGASFEVISDHAARMELWNSRHNAAHAFTSRSAGRRVRGTDICVPISEMPNSVTLAEKSLRRHGFEGLTAGHVGDGNYHVVFMYDAEDKDQAERAEEMIAEMVTQALSVGGTCTGEHGIGMGKKHFLRDQHGELLPLMRSIKACFDPNGILNPDKIFDAS